MTSNNRKKIQHDKETLPFQMDYLPEYVQKKAEVELNETPENRVKGISELKLMAKADQATSDIDFHEDFLRQFLRHNKYNVKKSFIQLRNFVNLRKKYKTLFQSVSLEDLLTKASYKCGTVLPQRCPDGCTMLLTEMGKFDPDEMPIDDFKRTQATLCLQALRDPMTQINGIKTIHDFKGTTLKHLRHCTPHNLSFLYHAIMDCFPGRYKEMHLVNQSVLLSAAWTIVRPFLSEKMRKRVIFHSSANGLLDHFPRSVLPVEYGGYLRDHFMADWMRDANEQHGASTMEGQPNYY